MISYSCPFEYNECTPGCKYWCVGKCEIMNKCEFIIQKHLIDDILKWREKEYEKMKIPKFHWMYESKANLIWYNETEYLKKLRGDNK